MKLVKTERKKVWRRENLNLGLGRLAGLENRGRRTLYSGKAPGFEGLTRGKACFGVPRPGLKSAALWRSGVSSEAE